MVSNIGDAITLLGLVLTLAAYFVEHRGRSLGQLEPQIARAWGSARAWVARVTGRRRDLTVHVGAADGAIAFDGSAVVMVWHQIQPDDDLAVKVDKVIGNLDALRSNAEALRALDRAEVSKINGRLSERIGTMEADIDAQRQHDWNVTTTAMRLQVRYARSIGARATGSPPKGCPWHD